jgi:hypothetical protein
MATYRVCCKSRLHCRRTKHASPSGGRCRCASPIFSALQCAEPSTALQTGCVGYMLLITYNLIQSRSRPVSGCSVMPVCSMCASMFVFQVLFMIGIIATHCVSWLLGSTSSPQTRVIACSDSAAFQRLSSHSADFESVSMVFSRFSELSCCCSSETLETRFSPKWQAAM